MVIERRYDSRENLAETLTQEAEGKKWSHLFIFGNTVLIILAITLMAIMIGLEEYWKFFHPYLAIYRQIHGFGIISTGCSICICACFGYLVCCTQKSSHFIWYGMGLLIMLVLDIKIIITGAVNEEYAHRYINRTFYTGLNHYHNNTSWKDSIDTVQLSLTCCGGYNYTDWFDTPTRNMPYSCCPFTSYDVDNKTICIDDQLSEIFDRPCIERLLKVPDIGLLLLYSIATILISVKTLCLVLTVRLESITRD